MQPLIDADVLRYEIGFAAEAGWQSPGFPSFDYVAELLDNKIRNICAVVGATAPPILYLTGKSNFRYAIATRTPYKERVGNKPWHYKNLTAYMKAVYDVRMQEGLEADDLMSIEQTRRERLLNGNPLYSGPTVRSIICTRDKDLFNFPGWKYSWELGNQVERGPLYVDEIGSIFLSADNKKLSGYGGLFFYAQCLMGDSVDSIPGLPKCGPKKSYDALFGITRIKDAYNQVLGMYKEAFNEDAEKELTEQARLLHMTRYVEGRKIELWVPPEVDYKDMYDIDTGTIERTPLL
jgi:hypothetical protein